MQALWNNTVIAERDDTVIVDAKHYFPVSALKREYITFSHHSASYSWEGQASQNCLPVKEEMNPDVVCYCADPKSKAANIQGRVAFWKGVKVV
jgi:uncharacterized protein (DUF427 family)